MPIGPSDLLSALQNGVIAIRDLTGTINNVFPHSTTVSSVALSTGPNPLTFLSSVSQGFLSVITSSGGAYRIPVY